MLDSKLNPVESLPRDKHRGEDGAGELEVVHQISTSNLAGEQGKTGFERDEFKEESRSRKRKWRVIGRSRLRYRQLPTRRSTSTLPRRGGAALPRSYTYIVFYLLNTLILLGHCTISDLESKSNS